MAAPMESAEPSGAWLGACEVGNALAQLARLRSRWPNLRSAGAPPRLASGLKELHCDPTSNSPPCGS